VCTDFVEALYRICLGRSGFRFQAFDNVPYCYSKPRASHHNIPSRQKQDDCLSFRSSPVVGPFWQLGRPPFAVNLATWRARDRICQRLSLPRSMAAWNRAVAPVWSGVFDLSRKEGWWTVSKDEGAPVGDALESKTRQIALTHLNVRSSHQPSRISI